MDPSSELIEQFLNDLRQSGVAGRERPAVVIFLSNTTRYFERPASIVVKGQSSLGKSVLCQKVNAFFPDEAFVVLSGMSGKALIHDNPDYVHRMVYVAEADGIPGEAMYIIRNLQSDGVYVYKGAYQSANGGYATQEKVIKGPISLLLTTTRPNLFHDNETRMVSIELEDSREAIEAGMDALVDDAQGPEVDYGPWHARHRALGDVAAAGVVVPYMRQIVEFIKANPSAPPARVQRDLGTLRTLIQASALLHHEQRERDEQGRIVADLHDYALVLWAYGPYLAQAHALTVPDEVRAVVEAVAKLTLGKPTTLVSQLDVANELGWHKSTASRWIRVAVSGGYLQNLAERGWSTGYKLKLGARDRHSHQQPPIDDARDGDMPWRQEGPRGWCGDLGRWRANGWRSVLGGELPHVRLQLAWQGPRRMGSRRLRDLH